MFDRIPKGSIALAAMAMVAGTASADISSIVFSITAELPDGRQFPWRAELNPTEVDANGDYTWTLANPVSVMDGVNPVFTLQTASLQIIADPAVSLNFNVIAGQQNTVFTVNSAVLSFAPLANAVGRATAEINVSDITGDGAILTPWGSGAYRSRYNGGTTFQNLIGDPIIAPAFGSGNSDSQAEAFPAVGFHSIGTTLTDIESQWQFSLSAGDIASGTSEFVVIPAPASAILGLTGLVGLRRRR